VWAAVVVAAVADRTRLRGSAREKINSGRESVKGKRWREMDESDRAREG